MCQLSNGHVKELLFCDCLAIWIFLKPNEKLNHSFSFRDSIAIPSYYLLNLCHNYISSMSAIFNFQSLLSVILLLICTCAYLRSFFPSIMDRNKTGLLGSFWKCARIGERKSPYVAACCVVMAFSILFLT